jgi:ComF family protein
MPIAPLFFALLPPTCALCGAPGWRGRDLCVGCASDLPANRVCCPRCARPLDGPLPLGAVCGACLRRPPPFERSLAALRYENPVPYLVGAAKFRGRLACVRLLGQLLLDAVQVRGLLPPEVLVPVPLHPVRLAERGYNQALEIARVLGGGLDLPLDGRCCHRATATPPQAGLDEAARQRNIRGVFAAQTPFPWSRVAIVDDVVTTGSTVSELARVLRRAGAREIEVWAAARTP